MSAAESIPPRTSGSSHSRTSHRDRPRQSRQPVFSFDLTAVRWTAPGAKPHWKTKEPESLADMEASVRQVARGASDTTLDGVIQYMEGFRARLNEDLRSCAQELREVRGSAAATGPPGPTRHLMGQVQGLSERVDVRQNQIDALTREKTHTRDQCDQMATAQTTAQRDIGQLRAQNEQLKQENERLRQELLAAKATPRPAGPPSVSSKTSSHSGMVEQERIRQLTADANRIRGEREALRRDNAKLKAANEEWRKDAKREKLRNDSTIDKLNDRLQEAENRIKWLQVQPSSHLPSHREMGGHRTYLPTSEGRTSSPTGIGETLGHAIFSTSASQTTLLEGTSSPQAPPLAPQRSASATSQEEAMESDAQADSGPEEQ